MMLKKQSYIFSIFLLFSLCLEAKSLLYKVSSQDSTVYILGSIHLAKQELYPLDKEITLAYRQSDILVVELDPSSEESMAAIVNAMKSSGFYSSGKSLSTELTPDTYRILTNYMDKRSLSISQIQGMRPWVVMLQLSVAEMIRLGYSPDLGIDKYFLDRAALEKKTVIPLETAEEQMSLLSRDDKVFQDRLLLYTLESMDELEPILNDMFRYWREGDTKALNKMISMPLESNPSLDDIYNDLIIKRNYRMVKKIEDFLRTKKNYFVVVGSGHIIGEEGIISLLKHKGYQSTQK